MAEMTPRTLSGFMELLPRPQQQMERMMDILRRIHYRPVIRFVLSKIHNLTFPAIQFTT